MEKTLAGGLVGEMSGDALKIIPSLSLSFLW
jgi:hypothetical protein